MVGNSIKDSKAYKTITNRWRSLYCIVFPIIAVILYLYCYFILEIKVWNSGNFSNTLTSIVTFVSIIISFFGVLLTLLISAKEKSKLINYFLASADKKYFVSSINKLIMYGLLTVILCAVLFMNDIMEENVILVFSCVCIFTLIKFTTLTYRFTNILLLLFIKDKNSYEKKEGIKLDDRKKDEMDERIRNGI